MSLWAEYIKERLGAEALEVENGFITFKITGESCEIFDIYVRPDKRREGLAWFLAKDVELKAKEAGAKRLVGSVYFGTQGMEESLQAQIAYGFKVHHTDGSRIILVKEIGG